MKDKVYIVRIFGVDNSFIEVVRVFKTIKRRKLYIDKIKKNHKSIKGRLVFQVWDRTVIE